MFNTSDSQDAAWEVLKWFTNFDGGEWAFARAISYPAGSPPALIAANEFFWNEFLTAPENRTRFLKNPDFAVVPFGGSWDGRFFDQSSRKALPQIWEGAKSVEEVARELDAMWIARLEETGRLKG
jgi:ABC-type glycerol-3-phosphate transport system substrate-binding protein